MKWKNKDLAKEVALDRIDEIEAIWFFPVQTGLNRFFLFLNKEESKNQNCSLAPLADRYWSIGTNEPKGKNHIYI